MGKKYSLYEGPESPRILGAEEKLAELNRVGLLHAVPVPAGGKPLPVGPRRKGALKRFLEDRQ